jgi:hypothetical protein
VQDRRELAVIIPFLLVFLVGVLSGYALHAALAHRAAWHLKKERRRWAYHFDSAHVIKFERQRPQ